MRAYTEPPGLRSGLGSSGCLRKLQGDLLTGLLAGPSTALEGLGVLRRRVWGQKSEGIGSPEKGFMYLDGRFSGINGVPIE